MKYYLSLLAFLLSINISAQEKPAYKIYTGTGKKADYGDILKSALKAEVTLFGEIHDNPIAHWLELELAKSLHDEIGKELILAAEMFEKDNQLLIDEYLGNLIKVSSFENEVRLWDNYKTDYKPLVTFAKENGLLFVASNIPRRYASAVAGGGFEVLEKLSPEALQYLAPLPIAYDPELACYKDMLTMNNTRGHASENLPKAQAVKDATMANSIINYLKEGKRIIHYNGNYHSDRYMGIVWYLQLYKPGTRIMTISTVQQDDPLSFNEENLGDADFIIVVPSSMTKTF